LIVVFWGGLVCAKGDTTLSKYRLQPDNDAVNLIKTILKLQNAYHFVENLWGFGQS